MNMGTHVVMGSGEQLFSCLYATPMPGKDILFLTAKATVFIILIGERNMPVRPVAALEQNVE